MSLPKEHNSDRHYGGPRPRLPDRPSKPEKEPPRKEDSDENKKKEMACLREM